MSSKKNIIKPTIAQVAEIVADHSTPASTGLVDTYGNSILKSEEPTGVTYSTFKDLGANPQEGDLISLVTQDTVLELPNPIAVKHGFFRRHPTIAKVGLAAGYLFAAVAGAYIVAHTPIASASDADIGGRGPGPIQLDSRLIYSTNDLDTTTWMGLLMPKIFTGDDVGLWGQATIPYKSIETLTGSNQGIGDISLMVGPRGRINDFYFRAYGGIVLPTGDFKADIPLGNGRQDIEFGIMMTQYLLEKQLQISGTLSHTSTGVNNLDVNPPDLWSYGLIGGVKLDDKITFGMGIAGIENEIGDHAFSSKLLLKYAFSKQFQLELMQDIGMQSRNIPMANTTTFIMRYNFGVK